MRYERKKFYISLLETKVDVFLNFVSTKHVSRFCRKAIQYSYSGKVNIKRFERIIGSQLSILISSLHSKQSGEHSKIYTQTYTLNECAENRIMHHVCNNFRQIFTCKWYLHLLCIKQEQIIYILIHYIAAFANLLLLSIIFQIYYYEFFSNMYGHKLIDKFNKQTLNQMHVNNNRTLLLPFSFHIRLTG